jgi:SOS response associated peptidase (SRAP)
VGENWERQAAVLFRVNEGELFAFAGIWDRWQDRSGNVIETCSILTTTPNAVTSAVHDRMPVFFDPDNYDLWLDPGMRDASAASELLRPCDARLMRCYPVSTRLNHVANDDEECSAAVELAQLQNRLFSQSGSRSILRQLLLNCSEFSSRLSKITQALYSITGIQFRVGSRGLDERWSLGSV